MGGVVTLDMGLTAWTTVAVCAFLLAMTRGPSAAKAALDARRMGWAMALAVLSKGLIGIVFPAAAIFLHCLVQPRLAAARAAGVGARHGALPRDRRAVVRAGVGRQSGVRALLLRPRAFRALPHHGAPPRAAVVVLLADPVRRASCRGCSRSSRRRSRAGAARRRAAPSRWRRFALLWCAFVMVFFSASGSKLPAYVLPVFPVLRARPGRLALAHAGAEALEARPRGRPAPRRRASRRHGARRSGAKNDWTRELYAAARPWILAGIARARGRPSPPARCAARREEMERPSRSSSPARSLFIGCLVNGYDRLAPRQSGPGSWRRR